MKKRYIRFYGNDLEFSPKKEASLRDKWARLSEFIKEIKQSFSRYYNKRHHRRGTLWGERFKSLIVENGETLVNCLAYIDLNPLRAGIVSRPEEYRWNSLGYHVQTNNRDNFLSTDFGLKEFKHHFNSKNEKKPKPVKGLSGVYSLKRLSEAV